MSPVTAAAAALLLLRRQQRRRRKRWVKPFLLQRGIKGEYSVLFHELREREPEHFRFYLRMTVDSFDSLLNLVENSLSKCHTNYRTPISAAERLALTLRYMGHGDSQRLLSLVYRIGASTVNGIIKETLQVLCRELQPIVMPDCTIEMFEAIASGFKNEWNFPNCIGAIDGKHIRISCPPCSGSKYYNFKGYYSVILLAIVDHNYKFTMINVGNCGSQNDSGTFSTSQFGKKLEANELERPTPMPLLPGGSPMPFVFVGDEGFPPKDYLLRPYPGKNLSDEKAIFNYRLSRARRVIENTFGQLTQRWRIFYRTIQLGPQNAKLLVKAACFLQNFLQNNSATEFATYQEEAREGETNRAHGSGNSTMQHGPSVRGNVTRSSKEMQAIFADYFMSDVGSIPWQMQSIGRQ